MLSCLELFLVLFVQTFDGFSLFIKLKYDGFFLIITLFIYSYVFPRKFSIFLVNINPFFFEKHSSVHYFICKTSIDMNDTSFCRYT